jgi:uncharacterized membrane protein
MIKHLTSFFTRALLALALAGGANTAFAGPMYHVTVDTASLTGTGYLDLTFAARSLKHARSNKLRQPSRHPHMTGILVRELIR